MIGRGLVIGGAAYALIADGLAGLAVFAVGVPVVFWLCSVADRSRGR